MTNNYKLISIPGKKLIIPVIDDDSPDGSTSVKSPEWMIKMDEILSSNVDGYDKYGELFGWYAESSRFSSGDISNQHMSSATLKHSDLVVFIPCAGYAADLETKMNTGTPIEELTIVRLGNVKSAKVALQSIKYTICRIQSFQQQLDRLFLHFNVTTRENTIFVYDADGNNTGQSVSSVDYSKATMA